MDLRFSDKCRIGPTEVLPHVVEDGDEGHPGLPTDIPGLLNRPVTSGLDSHPGRPIPQIRIGREATARTWPSSLRRMTIGLNFPVDLRFCRKLRESARTTSPGSMNGTVSVSLLPWMLNAPSQHHLSHAGVQRSMIEDQLPSDLGFW